MPTPEPVVGRGHEQEKLGARLTSRAGLITLVGPGGVGKTTLAQAVLRTLTSTGALREGLFVDVSESASGNGVIGRVGAALSLSVEGVRTAREAAARIGVALAARGPCLVVIDNAEQVLHDLAELVHGWLLAAPELRLLVTSREPLGVVAEEVMPLEVLPIGAAMELFEQRARAARPDLTLADVDPPRLRDIVEQLDRLPLAIELAAARLEVLSLEQLRERLGQQLKLLKSAFVRGPERHRALSATIAWSWDLLGDDERAALAQTSVFRGGFTLDAAEAVLETAGEVLDALHALKRKSLVTIVRGERPRFALLETVRAFASERLDDLGERGAVELRHARYFARPPRGTTDAFAIADETDNLVAAHRYARAGAPREAAELALLLARLLAPRVPVALRMTFLDDAVADAERAAEPELRARAHLERAELRRARGEHSEAEDDLDAATNALEGASASDALLAAVWSARGALYGQRGDLKAADDAIARALAASAHAPEVRAVALMRRFALRIVEERLDEAEVVGSEALALLERSGDLRNQGVTLGNLAALRLELGRLDEACATAARALELQRAIGDPMSQCMSLLSAALAHIEAERPAEGRSCAQEALSIAEREADRRVAGFAHASLGLALEAEGALDDAILELTQAEACSAEDDAIAARFHPRSYRAVLVARRGDIARSESLLASVDTEKGPPGTRVTRALLALSQELAGAGRESKSARAKVERRARALLHETREVRGVHPRLARRWLQRALEGHTDTTPAGPELQRRGLEVGPEARFATTTEGTRVDLSRRGPTRRLLLALVEAREAQPGNGVSVDALIDAGWPEEKMSHASAVDRVYAAIRQLRLLGFDECLLTRDDGYLIDPDIDVKRVPA